MQRVGIGMQRVGRASRAVQRRVARSHCFCPHNILFTSHCTRAGDVVKPGKRDPKSMARWAKMLVYERGSLDQLPHIPCLRGKHRHDLRLHRAFVADGSEDSDPDDNGGSESDSEYFDQPNDDGGGESDSQDSDPGEGNGDGGRGECAVHDENMACRVAKKIFRANTNARGELTVVNAFLLNSVTAVDRREVCNVDRIIAGNDNDPISPTARIFISPPSMSSSKLAPEARDNSAPPPAILGPPESQFGVCTQFDCSVFWPVLLVNEHENWNKKRGRGMGRGWDSHPKIRTWRGIYSYDFISSRVVGSFPEVIEDPPGGVNKRERDHNGGSVKDKPDQEHLRTKGIHDEGPSSFSFFRGPHLAAFHHLLSCTWRDDPSFGLCELPRLAGFCALDHVSWDLGTGR